MLGDNSGRPALSVVPRLFKLAARLGIPILPGSDPLPFPGEERKIGRYGLVLRRGFDPTAPGESLKACLTGSTSQPTVYGGRERILPFLLLQARMQAHKRRRAF